MMTNPAVLLLSGGLDSTVAAFHVRRPLHALTVDYGQRHWVELDAARRVAALAPVCSHTTTKCRWESTGALVDPAAGIPDAPASVLPARNMILLTLAAVRAVSLGARDVIIGACKDDEDVYFDCRREFLAAAQHALGLALGDAAPGIVAPFLGMTKGEILALDCVQTPECRRALAASWSCYAPQPVGPTSGFWRPCLECGACVARARGFRDAGLVDPALAMARWDRPDAIGVVKRESGT